jgi:hypothetical protein
MLKNDDPARAICPSCGDNGLSSLQTDPAWCNGRAGCLAAAHRSNAAFGEDWKMERENPTEWRRKWGRLASQQDAEFRSRQETPDAAPR